MLGGHRLICTDTFRSLLATLLLFSLLVEPVLAESSKSPLPGILSAATNSYRLQGGDIITGYSSTAIGTPRALARTFGGDRWPNGIIHYALDTGLDSNERSIINGAIDHWNQRSTILLLERTSPDVTDYLQFESAGGCASWVGRIGGSQVIWIGPMCTEGSMIHEIGHAVGLFHEHTRADRDSFITVQWANVTEGKELNFEIIDQGTELLGDYDYGSIMHYGPDYFSKNGQDTILVPDGISIGQRIALSEGDLAAVADMYATDLSLTQNITEADDGLWEIELFVSNIGVAGANTLELVLPLVANSQILSINSDRDWQCTVDRQKLLCESLVLPVAAETTVFVELSPGDLLPEQAIAGLTSRTFDTDISNNGAIAVANVDQQTEPDDTTSGQDSQPLEVITEPSTTEPVEAEANTEGVEAQEPQNQTVTETNQPANQPATFSIDSEPDQARETTDTEPETGQAFPDQLKAAVAAGSFDYALLLIAFIPAVRRSLNKA